MVTSFVVGDTWSFVGNVQITDSTTGMPVDLTGFTIRSQMFTFTGKLVDTFIVNWIDVASGTFSHKVGSTAKWTPGEKVFNLVFSSPNGEVISTDTQTIKLVARTTT